MKTFSVIIPVYNIPENYLRQCLGSMLKQQFCDIEYIVIDDGSEKKCADICDEYAKIDDRFVVFHSQNMGVSYARNIGLEMASGKYILFVDGDDYIPDNTIEKCLYAVNSIDCDLILFKKAQNNGTCDYSSETITCCNKNDIQNMRKSTISHEEPYDGYMVGSPCMKIYKLDLIKSNNIRFVVGLRKCQDRVFAFDYISKCESAAFFDFYGYYYVVNPMSITNRYNKNIIDILNRAKNEFKNRISKNVECDYVEPFQSLCLRFLGVIFQLDLMNSKNNDSVIIIRRKINELVEDEDYNDAIFNGNLRTAGKKAGIVIWLVKHKCIYTAILIGKFLM